MCAIEIAQCGVAREIVSTPKKFDAHTQEIPLENITSQHLLIYETLYLSPARGYKGDEAPLPHFV